MTSSPPPAHSATGVRQYALAIVELAKDGFAFDPASSNVLTGTIDIAP